jgi:hypothetical protein
VLVALLVAVCFGPAATTAGSQTGVLLERIDVRVPGFSFEPVVDGEPPIPEGLRASVGVPGFRLVQFAGTVTDRRLDAVVFKGLIPLQYYPHDAYLCWDPTGSAASGLTGGVARWVGLFHPAYKLDPGLTSRSGLIAHVIVLVYDDGRLLESLRLVEGSGTVLRSYPADPAGTFVELVVEAEASALAEIARIDTVLWLGYQNPRPSWGDEMASSIVGGNYLGGVPQLGYRDWLDGLGFDGTGVVWSVNDTGIDHDHPDLVIAGGYSYPGCDSLIPGDEIDPPLGHGTPVGGIVAGNAATGMTDGGGFLYGLGVAPGTALYSQNMCNAAFPPPGGWQELSQRAVQAGADGSNNSWWQPGTSGYDALSRVLDFMVRDGDFDTPEVEPHPMIFIAGNDGPGGSTVTTPAEAKNVIVVGATENYRVSGDIDAIAVFSSRGPTDDGRIVPTVMAPGEEVASTRNDGGGFLGGFEIPGTGGLYTWFGGTSAAAPHISGAAAVIIEWWRAVHDGDDPSPAMLKALLVNAAVDITGAPPVPNFDEGWGRAHLAGVIAPPEPAYYVDQEHILTDTGESWQRDLEVADAGLPLKLTLAWSDAPGAAGANPALVNDLDLRVVTGGSTYLGNSFVGGWSVPGGGPDTLNNLENVFVEAPGTTVSVTVEARQIAGDGVPGNGDLTDQDFVLVCGNCLGPIFSDGFESGDTSAWSLTVP